MLTDTFPTSLEIVYECISHGDCKNAVRMKDLDDGSIAN